MADANIVFDIIDEAIKTHEDKATHSREGYDNDELIMQLVVIIELQEIKIEALKRLAEEES